MLRATTCILSPSDTHEACHRGLAEMQFLAGQSHLVCILDIALLHLSRCLQLLFVVDRGKFMVNSQILRNERERGDVLEGEDYHGVY